MKKAAFLSFCAVVLLQLTACTKDYTCTCTYTADSTGVKTVVAMLGDYEKSEAEATCDSATATYKRIDPNATCVLK